MKKLRYLNRITLLLLLTTFLSMSMLAGTAEADAGIWESYVIINRNSGGNTYHKAQSGDFNDFNLGTFGCGNTMILNGAQIKTFKNNSSDVTGGTLFYRVYPTSSSGGSFSSISLAFGENYSNPGDQRWETNNANVNILNNLGAGTYYLEVYFQANTNGVNTSNPVTDNNGGNNYKATFTVLARSKATSGNWSIGSTWEGDAVPASDARVEICNGHTVTLTAPATARSVRIVSGGALSTGSNTLTLSGLTDKSNSFTNAGTFTSGSGSVIIEGEGAGTNLSQVSNSPSHVFNDVTVRRSGGTGGYGVDFFDNTNRAKIDGIFTIGTFGYVAQEGTGGDGRPIYGTSSTLRYNSAHTEGDPFNSNEEWDQQGGWTVGTSPAAPQNVEISSNDWVSLNVNLWERRVGGNLTIAAGSGLILQTGNTANLKVAGSVTNNGTIKQTATLNNSSFHFANIKDASNADKYYGVNISTTANMGGTTVWVDGNQDCPNLPTGVTQVKRCYRITPGTSSQVATVTFYYRYAELNGQTVADLKLYKYASGTNWFEPTGVTYSRSACTSGDSCSVQVSGLTVGSTYLLSSNNPLAITLADFYAEQIGDAVQVVWETNSELDNRGFNLWRGVESAGPDRQLNSALIPSQSQGSPGGFTYDWLDTADLVPGTTYYYWLEDVDVNGTVTRHGPVSVEFFAPSAVGLRSVGAADSATAGSATPILLALVAAALVGSIVIRKRIN